jgi:AraC-like DNA-binding protein
MNYIRTAVPARGPQLLQVNYRRQSYDFVLLHAEQEHYRQVDSVIVREHAHNVYHFILYTGGENEFLLDGGRHPARRGTLAITAPGEPHLFTPCRSGSAASKEITFCFEGEAGQLRLPVHRLLSLVAGVELPPVAFPVQLNERNTMRFEATYDHLIERLAARDAFCWFAEQQLMLELFSLVMYHAYGAPHPAGRADDPLVMVRAEIERRYNEPLTVDDLAARVFLSAGYLTRAFKARFGLPPIAYQQALRIRAAQSLLASTTRSVTEIAGIVGYQEIGAFSKAFTKCAGLSPLAYRKGQR